jgi:RNA polymerase primary sigma factor
VLVDDISDVLAERPGLTADELTSALLASQSAGRASWGLRAITLALFEGRERFRSDDDYPRRWWLSTGHSLERASRPNESRPRPFDRTNLYEWQRDALDSWAVAKHRGVVEAVTGSGKTMLGIAAALDELAARGNALVVVPTVDLMHQWRRHLAPLLPSGYSIGCLGGGVSASFAAHDIVVGVVNSLREADLRATRRGGLLVADECHRYASPMNRLVLDLRFERRLGLSATYARDDQGHLDWLDPYFGGTCFRMGYQRAVGDGVTARFTVALVAVSFSPDERLRYEELTVNLGALFARLMVRHQLPMDSYGQFMRALNLLASGTAGSDGDNEARAYLSLLIERRRLLAQTPAKTQALAALGPAVAAADRSIVFTRSIETAERAESVLKAMGLRAGVVHSRLPMALRREVLRRFADGDLQVISAPQVLDEGIDVPEADLAIILGASRSRRQMIQRMGRVLRRKPDRRHARFAVLYVEATVEDPAEGAHETFLEEITDVADGVRTFQSDPVSLAAAVDFLRQLSAVPA